MPTFAFVVKDQSGKTHHGVLDAESRSALLEDLWKKHLVVLSVEDSGSSALQKLKRSPLRVKSSAMVVFARQMATMTESGIPIVSALNVLSEQTGDRNLKRILQQMRADVESGASFSEAARRHPQAFSELIINMIQAGESSGRLDELLDRLAAYLEKVNGLQRKVRVSLVYPAFVSLMAFGITTFLVVFIVPKFRDIFQTLGGELPLPTRLLLDFSELTRRFWVLELLAMVGFVVGLRLYVGTPVGRAWFDRMLLRLPVLGPLFRRVAIARFARTLATLTKSGVQILPALEIVAKTAGNKVIEQAIMAAKESIGEGENIADPLAASKVFPPMVTHMIAIGEKTGELEKMLSKVADFYENEVDAAVTALTSLIEPMIIGFLGIVIGGIAVALLLPVFNVSSLVGGMR